MTNLTEQLMACVELGKAVTSTLDRDKILDIILNRLSELIKAQNWSLYLVDQERKELKFEVVVGLNSEELKDIKIGVGEGVAGKVAETGEAIIVPDTSKDSRFSQSIDEKTGFVTSSLITLPLKKGSTTIGVLQIVNPEDSSLFDDEYQPILMILSDFVAIAINNALNHEKIETLTLTDDVSGYNNSRFLHMKLGELIDNKIKTSLVFLDMDNFKRIVDTYGHPLGSKVLKEVAQVIGTQMDEGDFLVRFGGDEYVIILPGQDKAAALRKVENVQLALSRTDFLAEEGHQVQVSASYGIANFPDDASDLKGILHSADMSMYDSKDKGKNAITIS